MIDSYQTYMYIVLKGYWKLISKSFKDSALYTSLQQLTSIWCRFELLTHILWDLFLHHILQRHILSQCSWIVIWLFAANPSRFVRCEGGLAIRTSIKPTLSALRYKDVFLISRSRFRFDGKTLYKLAILSIWTVLKMDCRCRNCFTNESLLEVLPLSLKMVI